MNQRTKEKRFPFYVSWSLLLVAFLAIAVLLTVSLYRPDRPIPRIVPGTSTEPTFRVQIIRPREGLPLGGLIPPQLFGVDAKLGFDSKAEDASYTLANHKLELHGGDWDVQLYFDKAGRIGSESEVAFNLIFENQIRRVRCKPVSAAGAKLEIIELEETGEFSGFFAVELLKCEDSETGESLGWPAQPLWLRGSFDRLTRVESGG